MIVRSKTKVRVLILLAGLALLIGGAADGLRRPQGTRPQYYVGRRDNGIAQYQNGDYASALVALGPYIRREEFSKDAEAIYAFAESRRRVEMSNGKHLAQAMTSLQRVLSFSPIASTCSASCSICTFSLATTSKPSSWPTRFSPSTRTIFRAFAPKPGPTPGRQLTEQARTICDQLNLLVPFDLEMRVLTLELLRDLDRRPQALEWRSTCFPKIPTIPGPSCLSPSRVASTKK